MQASGLLDPSRFESVQKQVEAARLDDVKAIAKWLIGQDVLTRFQAKALLAAPKTPLSFGDYVVTDELADAPFAALPLVGRSWRKRISRSRLKTARASGISFSAPYAP